MQHNSLSARVSRVIRHRSAIQCERPCRSSSRHTVVSASFATQSSSSLPLHPDCMCMNIDVNYSSSQSCCSIFDFPEYFFSYHNILTHSHTQVHTSAAKGEYHEGERFTLHSRNLNWPCGLCRAASFYPSGFFHQKDIFQYNRSSMPAWGVAKKCIFNGQLSRLNPCWLGWCYLTVGGEVTPCDSVGWTELSDFVLCCLKQKLSICSRKKGGHILN